jgi:DNA polymerase-3 subunit delta'
MGSIRPIFAGMKWNRILGHNRVKRLLSTALRTGRLPQALLLTGPEGVGKNGLALALASAVFCESPSDDDTLVDSCGTCRSCLQMAHLAHPNLRIIHALPAGKGDTDDEMKAELIDDIRSMLEATSENPYSPLRPDGATQIRIGQIREIKRSLSMSAMQAGRRLVLLSEAHEMTIEASNAFLKTLEEPHPDTILVLTSSKPERLLQTIVSRCQELQVAPLDDADIHHYLISELACTSEDAALVAPFAQGSISKAQAFLAEDMRGYRQDIVDLLRTTAKPRDFRADLVARIHDIADGRNKTRMEYMLSLLLLWLRDAHALALVGPEAHIVNSDQREALSRFAAAFADADFGGMYRAIERASNALSRNVTPVLVLLPLLLGIRRALFASRSKAAA